MLAWHGDIGRSGFGEDIRYNKDMYGNLEEALKNAGFGDKYNGQSGIPFSNSEYERVMNEILQKKHRFDPYNEVVVRFKDMAKKGRVCVLRSQKPPGWDWGKRVGETVSTLETCNEAFGLAETLNLHDPMVFVDEGTGKVDEVNFSETAKCSIRDIFTQISEQNDLMLHAQNAYTLAVGEEKDSIWRTIFQIVENTERLEKLFKGIVAEATLKH